MKFIVHMYPTKVARGNSFSLTNSHQGLLWFIYFLQTVLYQIKA